MVGGGLSLANDPNNPNDVSWKIIVSDMDSEAYQAYVAHELGHYVAWSDVAPLRNLMYWDYGVQTELRYRPIPHAYDTELESQWNAIDRPNN